MPPRIINHYIIAIGVLLNVVGVWCEAEPALGAGANPSVLASLVRRLPDVDGKKEILISYLSTVPTLSGDIDQYLSNISSTSSKDQDSRDRDIFNKKLKQISHCFTTDYYGSLTSGALVAAIVEINADPSILPNHHLRYVFGNTCGNDSHSTRLFMEHWQSGARVFIGPEKNCKTEAAMAAAQNLPMISYRCNDQDISRDDYHYRTFARTVPPSGEIFKAFFALMKKFNWRKFSVVYDVKKGLARNEMFETLKRMVEEQNEYEEKKFEIRNASRMEFANIDINTQPDLDQIAKAIEETMETTRIYLTFNNVRLFRRVLSTMGDMGLTEKGYMLIYLDTHYDWLDVYHAMNNHFLRDTTKYLHHSWDPLNIDERKMIDYAQSTISIIPTPVKLNSPKFFTFWKRAADYVHYFGVQKTDSLNLKGNRIACYLYDAVYLYARAVDELIRRNSHDPEFDPTEDGSAIIDLIVNKKYTSIQGFEMRIDNKGNSQGNFSLLTWQSVKPIMNPDDAKYYPMDHALDITSVFTAPENDSSLPTLSLKAKTIYWKTGVEPPPDEPICGFHGEKCKKNHLFTLAIMGAVTFVAVLGIVLSGLTYSRKFEKELAMIWRIEPHEVHRVIGSNESTSSLLAAASETSQMCQHPWFNEADSKGSGMRGVAYYKGTLCALKEYVYDRKPKDLTRDVKMELRVMRQLAHPNINNFMGIIVCQTSICAVREFCSKGSLLDVLRNADMKLDHLYIASFIEDLVKGMVYLHDSDVKIHGNLKSTNCLITSRWALQIADYGMHDVRDGISYSDEKLMWESFLWTAPETMAISGRCITRLPPTQKSDVYSFGIILHEIFTRGGPYMICGEYKSNKKKKEEEKEKKEAKKMAEEKRNAEEKERKENADDKAESKDVKEEDETPATPEPEPVDENKGEKIVRRIYNDPTFRPEMKIIEAQNYVKDVMTACWHHDPCQRPDFKSGIRNKLKPLFTQIYKRNIMDHMIVMMEKYQTQLEDLVEERTGELREEQRRSQNLLQRMLPRTVADQLLRGHNVIPEAYPPVTIYFSDIVGFTRISGESTPMEIVVFLNKLYTLFDAIIRKYDVYKVETIGDAYMVVSGVPKYNTVEYHAEQIGMMSLHIMAAVMSFEIPHLPNEKLMIRIGMHSGPCAAGVVGRTMPRYTLFGDTVNTASRMESNGEALRIHCSEFTHVVLKDIGGFEMEERGVLPIKGKGHMTTYWLNGRAGYDFANIPIDEDFEDEFELFPWQNAKSERGSSWGVNRESSLSLANDKCSNFMKRISRSNIQDSSYFNSSSNREMPRLCEEDYYDDGGGGARKRKASKKKKKSCNKATSTYDNDSIALRKRSTSLPDGEVLNLDSLEGVSSVPAIPYTRRSTIGSTVSISTTNSQYPSYQDLCAVPYRRKRAIATVYPMRKRSLSVGDAIPAIAAMETNVSCTITTAANIDAIAVATPQLSAKHIDVERASSPEDGATVQVDDEKALIGGALKSKYFGGSMNLNGMRSCPQARRKDKKSFLRDPSPLTRRFREASPFSRKPFWSSKSDNRGDSITRIFRKWTTGRSGSEYEDLNNYELCEEDGFEMCEKVSGARVNRSVSCSPTDGAESTDNSEPLLTMSPSDGCTKPITG
ncbi:unnamed protein product [Caenorhabditis bovis]|uniref:Guanylate cyclase n=1 Tax=Caenorhabditis bovis TaxID=2654633 RepID=A0A8S1ETN2_9PELO|nr:unnamed protein product [Caenorhabditis bovis]